VSGSKRRDENAAYWVMLRKAEREIIEWAVGETGSFRQAAIFLGIHPSYIYKRCKRLGIDHRNYRETV
jgi:DNA-binding NtrC family response regulator